MRAEPILAELTRETWFVAFLDVRVRWWQRFHKQGFTHCFAFRHDKRANAWLVVDSSWTSLHVATVPAGVVGRLIDRTLKDGVILKAGTGLAKTHPPLLLTCAGVIAHMLRVPGRPLTPWRLYCALLRMGAAPMLAEDIGASP
jgi:hypothetical protein